MRKLISIKKNSAPVNKYIIQKEEANQFFKEKNYEKALKSYKKIIEDLSSESSESSESRGKKLSIILSNCIITCIKLANTNNKKEYYEEVERYSKQLNKYKEYNDKNLKKFNYRLSQAKHFLENSKKVEDLQGLCAKVEREVYYRNGNKGIDILNEKTNNQYNIHHPA